MMNIFNPCNLECLTLVENLLAIVDFFIFILKYHLFNVVFWICDLQLLQYLHVYKTVI